MRLRQRAFWVLAILTLAIGLLACGVRPSEPSPAEVPPSPAAAVETPRAPGQDDAAAQPNPPPTAGVLPLLPPPEIAKIYALLLETYVDPIDHRMLVSAARDGLYQHMLADSALPLGTLPLDLLPPHSEDQELDFALLGNAYWTIVRWKPEWANRTRPDVAMLRAMLASLRDSHTVYTDPQTVRRQAETSFSGIGVSLTRFTEDGPLIVMEIFPNSPAERVDLRRGDRLLRVEGVVTDGMELSDVVAIVRGAEGSAVKLEVLHPGDSAPTSLEIVREQYAIATVEARIYNPVAGGAGIGYIRIRSFARDVPEQVQAAIAGFLGSGQEIRGLVFDLRGNQGGSKEAVARVAGLFLEPDKPIGLEIDRARRQTPLFAESTLQLRPAPPLALLVNGDTSSGAEILASALREYGYAVLVGQKTAGSVASGSTYDLPDGSQVQITAHRFVTPSGEQLDGVGLEPDQPVELREADLAAGTDPPLLRALTLVYEAGTP